MNEDKFEITEELLQRYYDGELDSEQAASVERALESDSGSAAALDELRAVSRLLGRAADSYVPDELASRRTWEAVAEEMASRPTRGRVRRHAPWMGAVAAAAALVFYFSPLNIVTTAQASNELEIESIDCNYTSFMVIQPEEQNGHTIIWINDPASE